MARYFDIKITGGTAAGPYSIYYDSVNPVTVALITSSSLPATGLTYSDMTTGDGVNVTIPNDANSLLCYNNRCCLLYTSPSPRD